jgi:transglutaminase-like putative cysteine protease
MQKLPTPVIKYLEMLELELKQRVGVTPEEALCDAREHLCQAYCELQTQTTDDRMLESLIAHYGSPAVVADQYLQSAGSNVVSLPGCAPGWRICCTKCGRSAPAAKVGITRIGAVSCHKYTLGWCHDCRSFRWMRLLKDLNQPTLTRKLGVTTSAEELRERTHRPWATITAIVALVGALIFATTRFELLAAAPSDSLFAKLPPGWELKSSTRIPDQQTQRIGDKFGVSITQLTNSVLKDQHGELQVNTCRCTTEADAKKLLSGFQKLHKNPRDCIRNGAVVFELIPRAGNVRDLYARARYELAMLPSTQRFRVSFDAAPIVTGDPMLWNPQFNLFLRKQAGENVDDSIRTVSESFRYGDTIRLKTVGQGTQTSIWDYTPKPASAESIYGGDAAELRFENLPQRVDVPYISLTGIVTSTTYAQSPTDRAGDPSLTAATAHWPVDDAEIQQLARSITGPTKDQSVQVESMLAWMVDTANIEFKGQTGSRYGVRQVVEQKFGHCWDYADLFVTLCRANDVPARQIIGWLQHAEGHVWCEVLLNGKWRQVDPTTGAGCGSDYIPLVVSEDGSMPILYTSRVTVEELPLK